MFVPTVDRSFGEVLQDKRTRRAALLLALWVPTVAVLVVVREVLLPFILALLFAYLLAPLVRRLSSREVAGRPVPPWAAVLALYVGCAAALYAGGAIFVPRVYHELGRLARDGSDILNQLDDKDVVRFGIKLEALLDSYNIPIRVTTSGAPSELSEDEVGARELTVDLLAVTHGLARDARAWLSSEARLVLNQLQRMVTGVLGFVFKGFLVLMLTAFIAADTRRIMEFIYSTIPISDHRRLDTLLHHMDRGLSGVVRGQLTICLVNGVLTLVGLLLLKVKFAFLLGTVAAVFSLVPIFGSILSTVPIVLVALSNGPSTAALALLWILAIHALEANLLNPKILGDAARIHPALVVLALIIGEHYHGIVGALLAVPLMSILVTLFKAARARATELDEEIMAEAEALARVPPAGDGAPREGLAPWHPGRPTPRGGARRRRVSREHAAP